MYNIDLANVKSIVADIVAKHNVENVAFVGCGASKAELYPAKYFLANCSKKLRVAHYTANEFNYDTPDWLGDTLWSSPLLWVAALLRPSRPTAWQRPPVQPSSALPTLPVLP